jgi:hypothetical protein
VSTTSAAAALNFVGPAERGRELPTSGCSLAFLAFADLHACVVATSFCAERNSQPFTVKVTGDSTGEHEVEIKNEVLFQEKGVVLVSEEGLATEVRP